MPKRGFRALAGLYLKVVIFTKASTQMINEMVGEGLFGKMEPTMKETGRMARGMDKVNKFTRQVKLMRVTGLQANLIIAILRKENKMIKKKTIR